jgi:hypothetical protein
MRKPFGHPAQPRRVAAFAALAAAAWAAPAVAQGAPAPWVAVPEVRLGAADGAAALGTVTALAVGRDGTLYVADATARQVRRFTPGGAPGGAIGREGRGPGEFLSLAAMGWRGDTLWVSDPAQGRVQRFTADGRLLNAHTLLVAPRGGLLPDGTAVTPAPARATAVAEGSIATVPLLRVRPGGEVVDTVWRLSTRRAMATVEAGARVMTAPNPFGEHTLWAVAPDGSAVFVVERAAAPSAAPTRFRVSRLRPGGTPAYTRDYRYTPRPLAARDLEAAAEDWNARAAGAGAAAPRMNAADVRRVFTPPRFHPPVTAIVAGLDGTLWLRREAGQGEVTWTVLDERGGVAGYLRLPRAAEVMLADRRRVWTVERDGDGVPYVVRYAVRPRG